jgi:Proline-rich nuclear receptor coactivator motif
MSTPPAKSSKGPRPSPRACRNDLASMSAQNDTSSSELSPPKRATKTASTNPPPTTEPNAKGPSSAPRKKSHGSKKPNNASPSSRNASHTQTSSQTDQSSPDKKATPLKQAYAGPTFHSSPAASSLPLPSFYSKSLPTLTASPASTSATQLDGPGHADSDTETLVPIDSKDCVSKGREPSPLDFMFEAARKARDSPKTESPDFRAGRLSPFDDIPRNRSRTPGDNSSESVFPFELDGNGGRPPPMGPFTTPYRDRMEALRPSKAQSTTPVQTLDEKERKEKSEALKRLLIENPPLRSTNKLGGNSYFPNRASETQSDSPNLVRGHVRSGPPTPQSGVQHAPIPRHCFQNTSTVGQERDTPLQRPISSHLRREYQPDGHLSPAELDSDSATPPRTSTAQKGDRRSISGQSTKDLPGQPPYSVGNPTVQMRSSHSTQKLEDDLRRILKLDLTSSS